MSYYVYITQENDCFIADVPALPGCRTLGRSEAEVMENIRDVVRGYLQNLRRRNRALPKVKVVKLSGPASFSRGGPVERSLIPITSENGISGPAL
ncbi:MAG: type II toxin-antitoxin system HicB family antitoxin [Nitrospirae bacterium]|nr:type II toxin-antitoxin system HicB family antitoxin [Candidatus Manganitrophaceae bacterium]